MRERLVHLVRRNLREGDLGRAAMAMLLASLTVLAAVVAGLQAQASIEAQRGNREAERMGLEAGGQNASAIIQIGTAYGAYRRWFEQLERVNWAQTQLTQNANAPDLAAVQALKAADEAIMTWTLSQNEILNPPYFAAGSVDLFAYDAAKRAKPQVTAAEESAVEAEVASAWDQKASDYVTVLTILAVGLFFLGLGSTVGRRARPILAASGALFGLAALAWTLSTALAPIHRVPQEAVDQLVASEVGSIEIPSARGSPSVPAASRASYESSINDAGAAIARDPGYLAAYRARANTRVLYADAIIFTSGPDDISTPQLRGGIDDFTRYLGAHPEDYAAWWNLGWAQYLLGNAIASVDATNQALLRAPGQFPLYFNRALGYLSQGKAGQALVDIDEGIRRAATDSSDTASWYLGQVDFNIGRLAALHPDYAAVLQGVQTRLRETRVALRVLGRPTPAADAPQLTVVALEPVRVNTLKGAQLIEGDPLRDRGNIEAANVDGFRVSIGQAGGLQGRTISARLWLNGLPHPEFSADVTVASDAATLDLVSPYGRAGLPVDPGTYALDLYVDGARRFQASWTISPAPTEPQLAIAATPLVGQLEAAGFLCGDPAAADKDVAVRCTATGPNGESFVAAVRYDQQDRIVYVSLSVTTAAATAADPMAIARTYFTNVLKVLYRADVAGQVAAWLDTQNGAPDRVGFGGTTLQVSEPDQQTRQLDIFAFRSS